jgi:hypothetical protein
MDVVAEIEVVLFWSFALLAGWLAVERRANWGFVGKLGLMLASLGSAVSGYIIAQWPSCAALVWIVHATIVVHGGLLLIAAGWVMRVRRAGNPQRRASDFMALDETQPMARPEQP